MMRLGLFSRLIIVFIRYILKLLYFLRIMMTRFALREHHTTTMSHLYPRGGGTGTNAQSLGAGVVVDTSKHMNKILEVNVHERWARVQCGAVKDQLKRRDPDNTDSFLHLTYLHRTAPPLAG